MSSSDNKAINRSAPSEEDEEDRQSPRTPFLPPTTRLLHQVASTDVVVDRPTTLHDESSTPTSYFEAQQRKGYFLFITPPPGQVQATAAATDHQETIWSPESTNNNNNNTSPFVPDEVFSTSSPHQPTTIRYRTKCTPIRDGYVLWNTPSPGPCCRDGESSDDGT